MSLDRPSVLNALLRVVACFSNKEVQEQAWLKGEGSWGCDFDETCCILDDISEIIFNDDYKLYGISQVQYYILKQFCDEIYDFSENNPHIFLQTPQWQKIRKMAKDVIDAFNYKDE